MLCKFTDRHSKKMLYLMFAHLMAYIPEKYFAEETAISLWNYRRSTAKAETLKTIICHTEF